jgi:hypothetical protein
MHGRPELLQSLIGSAIEKHLDMPEDEQHNDGGWFFPVYQEIDF